MLLDLPALFVIAALALAVAGLLLLLSWLQNRNVRALALWAAAFMIGSIGVALISARGAIDDVWSITIANAIIATAYGIMWNGVRDFCGRPTSVLLMLAGAVIWVLACQVEAFFTAPYARAALMSAIVVAYSVLSAWGFWRVRDEALMSRLPIIILLLAHAVIVVIRVPLAGSLSLPIASREIHVGWWTFIIFEAVFFSFCVAHLLGGIATEQIVLWYKHASLIDPLTGVGNRRAILERGGDTRLGRRTWGSRSGSDRRSWYPGNREAWPVAGGMASSVGTPPPIAEGVYRRPGVSAGSPRARRWRRTSATFTVSTRCDLGHTRAGAACGKCPSNSSANLSQTSES